MTTYRITIYQDSLKDIYETDDEDEVRDQVDSCLDDLEKKSIKSFTVSWISEKAPSINKPFWED